MEKMKNKIYIIKDWINITIGAFLMAVATNLFFVKYNLVTGGVSGIGIIVKNFVDIPLWVTTLVLNIPLFVIAFMIKGRKFGIKSLYGMIILTFGLYITEKLAIDINDFFISCIYGGILTGIGIGMVFSGLGTTGGTDIIAIIVQHIFPFLKIADILRVTETTIVIGGMFVFGIEKGMYAIITIYIVTKVADSIMEGLRFGKVIYIISDKYQDISKEIMDKVERGVTSLNGEGMFSHNDKHVLMCVIRSKQVPTLKKIVTKHDENAFVFITDAREVLGEGFNVVTLND